MGLAGGLGGLTAGLIGVGGVVGGLAANLPVGARPQPVPPVPPGGVALTDNLAQFNLDDLSLYTDYEIFNRYEKDGHVYMLGVTSPGGFAGDAAAFVQLAAPTLLWVCDWTAARLNLVPEIPSPVPADSSWVPLDEHIETAKVTVGPDGRTPLYRISGTYVYGHKSPSTVTIHDVGFARPPWLLNSFARVVPTGSLTPNLKDGTGAVFGGGFALPGDPGPAPLIGHPTFGP